MRGKESGARGAEGPRCGWWTSFGRRPGASRRLVCFPYAGGTAGVFRLWHRQLPEEVELCAVQMPGRGTRSDEACVTRWRDLVPVVSEALLPLFDRPFALFGHSLGALVSFEVARWLGRHHGIRPDRLLVSGRRAPHLPDCGRKMWNAADEELIAHLRDLNGTPANLLHQRELLDILLPRLRADFRLVETYRCRPGPPLACPITAFGGSDDEETREGRLEAWSVQTSGGFKHEVLAGDHFFIHSREPELLTSIRRDLVATRSAVASILAERAEAPVREESS